MELAAQYLCALVAYDGTDYHGFQYQVGVSTVQNVLEAALGEVAVLEGRVVGAGRTDAGVHASGQVIAASVRWRHPLEDLERAWNAHLPYDVCVRRLGSAPSGFHPRFSADARTYRYTVFDCAGEQGRPFRRLPLTDRYALYEACWLDLDAMNIAAAGLLGEHDFATFGQPPQGENTLRRVLQAEWQVVRSDLRPLEREPARCLVFTITANAFLRQMVRNIVSALLYVGRRKWSPSQVAIALNARDRGCSPAPVAARGLSLEHVEYPTHLSVFGR